MPATGKPNPPPANETSPPPEPDVKGRDVPMPPPAVKATLTAEEEKINAAILSGVNYLKSNQLNSGRWDNGTHPVGYAALPGLALLECSVAAKHPSVQVAAKFVRLNANKLDATYELALAILFLDRLGDTKDRALIQTLAVRLIAGQTTTGGWDYRCPVLGPPDHNLLLAFLRKVRPNGELANPLQQVPQSGNPLPAHLKKLTIVQVNDGTVNPSGLMENFKPGAKRRGGRSGDNSNTQFAMLALWVARRHGVPMERTLSLVELRFRSSQNEDGGWGYLYENWRTATNPSMTCVGLLGLAAGHGFVLETPPAKENKRDGNQPKQGEQDAAIQRGLKSLGTFVGDPTGKGLPGGAVNLYSLWSLERVGVLYNLKTIGNKDWYGWATKVLLANQNANGSWWTRGYQQSTTTIDTCLALLVLKRSNLMQDLTETLRILPITDPDRALPAAPRPAPAAGGPGE
jgi:hypothetical protein